MIVRHPLQPFHARNFVPGAMVADAGARPRAFSYDRTELAGALSGSRPRSAPAPFLPAPLAAIAERHRATGVDVSAAQVAAARRNVPAARVLRGDVATCGFPTGAFGAIVAFYVTYLAYRNLKSVVPLLRPVLDRCDTEGAPAYLEATNKRNLPLYRRQGFEVREELDLPNGPRLWTMWREPGGG